MYQVLKASTAHPSADCVHKQLVHAFPSISLDTVNRTLLTFARIHIIDMVEGQGKPRRFDPDQTPHHHFYCVACNKIVDFHDPDLTGITLPDQISEQFTVTGKRLCVTGYCSDCRDKVSVNAAAEIYGFSETS